MIIDPTIFKAYDIRGVYPTQISEEGAYVIGRAIATQFLKDNTGTQVTLVVGADMRISTPPLKQKLIAGLVDSGVNVADVGLVSTPTFYYAVAKLGYVGGVQVSASHNPAEYNGFKIVRAKGAPVSGDGLKAFYTLIVDEMLIPLASKKGAITQIENVTDQAVADYIAMIDRTALKSFKVVIDPANAMGIVDYGALFKELSCEVVKMNFELDGTFPVHEADPLKPENTDAIAREVVAQNADFGIASDGDNDRIFILDEKGQVIPAQVLYILLALETLSEHPRGVFTEDVRFGWTVRDVFAQTEAQLVKTPAGHSLIKQIMLDRDALMGAEISGHFHFRFPFGVFESSIYVVLRLMEYLSKHTQPLSEIVAPYLTYVTSGEINTKVENQQMAAEKLAQIKSRYTDGQVSEIDGIRVDYSDWWFLVRASNTEPLVRLIVEAKTKELLEQKRDELLQLLRG